MPKRDRSELASEAHSGIDPYSAANLCQIAKVLDVDRLYDSDEEALQSAAWIYTLVCIEESGDCALLPSELRQLLGKIGQLSAELRACLLQSDNRTLRIVGAGYLIEEMSKLEARAHRARQALPSSGPLARNARHQFVDNFADIYERVTTRKAGLSKHDRPTGPFYRAVKTALGIIDRRAITGLQHVISDVVRDRKRRD